MARVTQRWRIRGRVQGGGFRDWMVREARSAGVAGWVRNAPGGEVEALVDGKDGQVSALLAAARRGPPLAHVASIEVEDEVGPAEPGFVRRLDHA